MRCGEWQHRLSESFYSWGSTQLALVLKIASFMMVTSVMMATMARMAVEDEDSADNTTWDSSGNRAVWEAEHTADDFLCYPRARRRALTAHTKQQHCRRMMSTSSPADDMNVNVDMNVGSTALYGGDRR